MKHLCTGIICHFLKEVKDFKMMEIINLSLVRIQFYFGCIKIPVNFSPSFKSLKCHFREVAGSLALYINPIEDISHLGWSKSCAPTGRNSLGWCRSSLKMDFSLIQAIWKGKTILTCKTTFIRKIFQGNVYFQP